jgi:hypothetical protein
LRQNPAAQRYVARLAQQHGKPKALTILAHKLARAVYYMLHRQQAFEATRFFPLTAASPQPNPDLESATSPDQPDPCIRRRVQRRQRPATITNPSETVMTAVLTH